MIDHCVDISPHSPSATNIRESVAPSHSTSSLPCHNTFYFPEAVPFSCIDSNNMPGIAAADTPPLHLERKLTSTVRHLRSASSRPQQRPSTVFEASRTSIGLDRLKSIKRRGRNSLTHEEALFFLGLPDKVRRQYFSREENILFRAACEINLSRNPGYGNVFSRQGPWMAERPSTGHSASASMSAADMGLMRHRALSDSTNSTDSDIPPSTPNFSLPRRRALSIVSTDADATTQSPESFASSRFTSGHCDMSRYLVKSSDTSPKETKYFLDNKTRSKIRQHLASPEAFDEMIAFGFAADQEQEDDVQYDTSASVFNRDGIMKHAQFDEEEDYTSTDTDDEPLTPNMDRFGHITSFPLNRQDSNFSFPSAERHMTLRVTLTKPEVTYDVDAPPASPHLTRSDTTVKTVESNDDPLALEQLTFSDDTTGMSGAFAIDENEKGIKKLWKKVKLQRSSSSMSGL